MRGRYPNTGKQTTHIVCPQVQFQNLVLLVKIDNLNELKTQFDRNSMAVVRNWPSVLASSFLVTSQKVGDKDTFCRKVVWKSYIVAI